MAYDPKLLEKLGANIKVNNLQFNDYRVKKIEGDGNCLFRAIAFLQYGTEEKWQKVKKEIRQYIMTHQEFRNIGNFEIKNRKITESFDLYISNYDENGYWGGDLEVAAAASYYNRPIVVVDVANNNILRYNNSFVRPQNLLTGEIMHLQRVNNNHFNALEPPSTTTIRPPLLPSSAADVTLPPNIPSTELTISEINFNKKMEEIEQINQQIQDQENFITQAIDENNKLELTKAEKEKILNESIDAINKKIEKLQKELAIKTREIQGMKKYIKYNQYDNIERDLDITNRDLDIWHAKYLKYKEKYLALKNWRLLKN